MKIFFENKIKINKNLEWDIELKKKKNLKENWFQIPIVPITKIINNKKNLKILKKK